MATRGVSLRGRYLLSKFNRYTRKGKGKCKFDVLCEMKDIEKKNLFVSFSEHREELEKKHYVFIVGSTETVNCSKEENEFGQIASWYNSSTGLKIKSKGRIKVNGLSLEIKSVQLDDAGTYECRGVSSTRFYTFVVTCEFS